MSQGKQFKAALAMENPLQLMGAVNAYCARMATQTGYQAIYLSGAAVANASFGIPDIGETSLANVCEEVSRIKRTVEIPLIVDMDTGWESPEKSVAALIAAGAAGAHIEDQVTAKKCGHLDGKQLVSTDEMIKRIQSAVQGKTLDPDFYLIARTDSVAQEGLDAAISRANAYVAAGADAIFAEALSTLSEYKTFCEKVSVPILANITEFGKTPLFTVKELASVGVQIILYPLSAFRAMNQAALSVYEVVRQKGSQKEIVSSMQDRDTLYRFLDY